MIYDWKYLNTIFEIVDICGEYCSLIPKENTLQTDFNEGMLNKDALYIVDYFKVK
jgi:hypothetical protein